VDSPDVFVPRRRANGLISEVLDGESLLYVEATHRAFCLNAAASRVWEAIDGVRDASAIARHAALDADVASGMLREMGEAGLLDEVPQVSPPSVDLSRRRLVRTGLVALPFIMAITVPRAAEAASACTVGLPGGPPCSPTTPCCAGTCNENVGSCG
jgi:hypothetical protein